MTAGRDLTAADVEYALSQTRLSGYIAARLNRIARGVPDERGERAGDDEPRPGGIRSLLAAVGIDVAGKTITVDGREVDPEQSVPTVFRDDDGREWRSDYQAGQDAPPPVTHAERELAAFYTGLYELLGTDGAGIVTLADALDAIRAKLAAPAVATTAAEHVPDVGDDPVANSGQAWRRACAVSAARADADVLNRAILALLPPALEFDCGDCSADPCRCDPTEQARVDNILAAWAACGWDTRRAASLARLAARATAPGQQGGGEQP